MKALVLAALLLAPTAALAASPNDALQLRDARFGLSQFAAWPA